MEYRLLGRSGCAVSAYALGTMTFGSETDEATSFAQLDAFVERGGTLLDCADVYGAGAAETIVGRWLARRPADVVDRMVIVTKGRFPATPVLGAEGSSRRHLRRALDASLRRLGRDHVDMFMVHSWDPLTPLEETLAFLDDAVRSGLVVYPGLSNYLGWQVQKAVDVARARGLAAPVALQPSYSLLVREAEWEILPAAADSGLGLLCWSPLGGGWLTGKYRRDERPVGATRLGEDPSRGLEAYDRRAADPQTWDVLDVVDKVATDRGATPAQVSLAWVAQRPGVSSVLLGARTLEQLLENLAAATMILSDDEMERLTAVSAPRAAPWPYGEDGAEQRMRRLPGR
ncbi:MAG TPA: aldo/keto reductase [Intrasporangium sp.]|uniref:aldo/keto reductase n=1 Tax=Intrasporangium sp. TaxID=1925024 RepID=UPI002D7953CC|nr:aldo/keto reductase [Intrasporangium sp.]HET7398731.1 aldo/keto reductase [Intrasporangium sp.]